ncbi:proteasomal ATPase-associated factor 1-like [Dreissena polymorpha]|uniref:Proteasomal ATPase-associated factor 1 n=1 Tax=Dreissena polymorpha TaxID=45954 RepID=A0A9D4D5K9_DREPO|nr:proteasomal ATPase-associated factor 1-like [Dreissena polymorpha]KAH3738336.1 hypothetical protein DPMN_044970 [Dreissena polymorpha]
MAAPRMILQNDFNLALREPDGRAWITFKCTGQESVHSHLRATGLSETGPVVTGSDGFSVQQLGDRSISVIYENDDTCMTRHFIAPAATYTSIHNQRKSIHCLDVSPGGLGVSTDTQGLLKVWETQSGDVRRQLDGHFGDVYTCRFFPSGVVILTGGADMQLKVWSAETGQCATTMKGHLAGILDTAIVDRGRNIVSCGRDGTARLWDCGSQQCLGTIETGGGNVNCCALQSVCDDINLGSPVIAASDKEVGTQDKLLALGCDGRALQGYGLHSRTKVFDLDCHDAVNTCAFISEMCLVCGTQDGHITVTDIRNVRVPLKEWKESRNAILSMCPYKGGFFTSTGDGSCFYVNKNHDTILELCGSDCDPVYRTVTDGRFIYTGCRDSNIRKYSLKDISDCVISTT